MSSDSPAYPYLSLMEQFQVSNEFIAVKGDNTKLDDDYTFMYTDKNSRWWYCDDCAKFISSADLDSNEVRGYKADGFVDFNPYKLHKAVGQRFFRKESGKPIIVFPNPPHETECRNQGCKASRDRIDKIAGVSAPAPPPPKPMGPPAGLPRHFPAITVREKEQGFDKAIGKVDSYCILCSEPANDPKAAVPEDKGVVINSKTNRLILAKKYTYNGSRKDLQCTTPNCKGEYGASGTWILKWKSTE